MNILVSDSWLREYLKTKATPRQIGKYLSLSSQSVEKITKVGEDWVYEIEVTTNRPDCLSVVGIAREAAAVLPFFGIKAQFVSPRPERPEQPKKSLPLKIRNDARLCRRVLGIVLDKIQIKSSPKFIHDRLEAAGVRSLTNIIDITNYVMLEIGHPSHAFDYDRIKTHQLIIRRAKKGEKIITLENKQYTLTGGDTVIDDGTGEIIDLPGIIGTENSVVTPQTKKVLFFIENNEPSQIRKTSMTQGIRTMAATFNEKGVDAELAMTALLRGIELYKKYAEAKVASEIIDIYPKVYRPRKIQIPIIKIKEQLGVEITQKEVAKILKSLNFKILNLNTREITIQVPSWRTNDISLTEDIIEEVSRIYGYHKLPSLLPTGELPKSTLEKTFYWEEKIKESLKNWGFTELCTYSMQSKEIVEKTGLNAKNCLKIKNPLTRELEYMRTSLIPSFLQVVAQNQAHFEEIRVFELANIYLPRKKQLPEEKPILIGVITGENKFYETKGIVEVLFEELGIKEYQSSIINHQSSSIWHPLRTAQITKKGKLLGILGEIHPKILANFGIEKGVVIFNLDAVSLFKVATSKKTYTPIPKYPPILEDLCFIVRPKTHVGELIRLIKQVSSIIRKVEAISSFNNQRTIRITFQHPKRTLKEKEVKKIREKIIEMAKKKLNAKLKTLE